MKSYVNHRKRGWTIAEEEFLRRNAETMKDEDIANHLRRNLKSVREKRRRLKIIKAAGRGIIALKGRSPKKDAQPVVDNPSSNTTNAT